MDNIKQITRAMELVARTKLRRTQEQAEAARPYSEELGRLMRRSVPAGGMSALMADVSPLLQVREVHSTLVIAFSADRGLCGAYNNNIIKRTARQIDQLESDGEVKLIPVGRQIRDHFRRRDVEIYDEFTDVGEEANLNLAHTLSHLAQREFAEERVDRVQLVYSEFVSVFQHPPVVQDLLPVTSLEQQTDDEGGGPVEASYLYEPSTDRLFEQLLPRYVDNSLYRALTEAKASEQAARVFAMKNATDNAGDLIEDLTRQYNRVRQSQITREITEIASGAEALAEQRR